MIIKSSERIKQIETYYFALKLAEIGEMNRTGETVLNLGIGSPDLPPHPSVIEHLREDAGRHGASKYQSYHGLFELRAAFAKHYEIYLNTQLDPNSEILPLIGSKEGIMHISMAFLNPGDEVLVPNPGYPSYASTAKLAGAAVKTYNLSEANGWIPDIQELEEQDLSKVKLMWINYPNMPTGANISIDQLTKLVSFAKRNEILLCHDNPYNFILNQHPLSILGIPGAKDCCLELYSLSKCFNMAGWRVGAVAGHPGYIESILRYKSNMDSGMYRPIQKAAIQALSLGQEWFDQLNATYMRRRKLVWHLFDVLNCEYDTQSAGLFVWAKVPDYIADVKEWVDDILREARVFITPGFIFGSNGNRFVRISLCSNSEDINGAMSRIEKRFIKSIA